MNIIMTSVAMLSTISLFVLICGGNPLLGALVFYLGSGFFVVFFTTSYMEIAPNMRMRELWPSAGRIVNNIGSLLVSSPAVALVTKGDVLGAVSAAIVLFIAIATSLLTRLGDDESGLLRGSVSDGASGADADNASASAASFEVASVSVEHELSFEEREVLQAIASSDESAQAIADSLYLSRSTLYRHISSMNKKTDTSSRAALIKTFWTWTDVS
jgi:DNA-binding CsgD family transcriptional regulator